MDAADLSFGGCRDGTGQRAILVAGLFLGLMVAAGAKAQPAAPRKASWAIDYGAQRCALVRTAEGGDPLTLAVRMIPGRGSPEVILAKHDWRGTGLVGARSVLLRFAPSGRELQADALWLPNHAGVGDLLQLDGIPSDFVSLFAESSRIDVVVSGAIVLAFPIPGAARAARALHECNSALLRAWGIDEAAYATLRQPPKPIGNLGDWIADNDFPRNAIDRNSTGMVVVRLDVDNAGRLSDCVVVATSGSSALDQQTCFSLRKRARYEPAVGPDGKPTAIALVQTVAWMISPTPR